jgi:hypothetical protein
MIRFVIRINPQFCASFLVHLVLFYPTILFASIVWTRMVTTRNKAHVQVAQDENIMTRTETLTERRQRWSTLLQQHHYQPIVLEVLDEELLKYENSTIMNTTDQVLYMRECVLMLASTSLVFAAAIEGTLVRRLLEDTDLQKEYAVIQERAHAQPSIYIHLLADKLGIAPTPNQYMAIQNIIQDYLTEGIVSKHAWQVDNITPPTVSKASSAQGHRKYLQTHNRSSKRIDTLRRFCNGVQHRWLETPASERDTPLPFPPSECGYSKDSHTRLAQHRAHQSSNYIMNLVEDICTYLYRTKQFDQHFCMHQFIIYLIFRPEQAGIAEILCSGLLQVWIENGGGFNAYPAGRSVATARRVSMVEWAAHERWTRRMSPLNKNMQMQVARAEDWRKALDGFVVDEDDVVDDDRLEGV